MLLVISWGILKGLVVEGCIVVLIWNMVGYSKIDWVSDRCSTSSYCVFVGSNLMTWKSKKQNNAIDQSSVKVEYTFMAHAACELMCVQSFLREMDIVRNKQMMMHCVNHCSKKRFKRPINRPLKCFRSETEQNLKKAIGLLNQVINSLKQWLSV